MSILINDGEEKMVYDYLLHHGFEDIRYEPNKRGNNNKIPPDFSIKGNIGIEVRRLNQHYHNGTTFKALEGIEYSLSGRIRNLLKSYANCEFDKSSFVMVNFSRPINVSKHLIDVLRRELDDHLPNIHLSKEFKIGNLEVKLLPSSNRMESAYFMGVERDLDSGGPLVSNLYRNLQIVINEKIDKIKPEFEKYDKWWLILIDYISYGMAEEDLIQLNKLPPLKHCFDKILLLSPEHRTQASEVKL